MTEDNKFAKKMKEHLDMIHSRPSFIAAENAYLSDLAKNLKSPGSVDMSRWDLLKNSSSKPEKDSSDG